MCHLGCLHVAVRNNSPVYDNIPAEVEHKFHTASHTRLRKPTERSDPVSDVVMSYIECVPAHRTFLSGCYLIMRQVRCARLR